MALALWNQPLWIYACRTLSPSHIQHPFSNIISPKLSMAESSTSNSASLFSANVQNKQPTRDNGIKASTSVPASRRDTENDGNEDGDSDSEDSDDTSDDRPMSREPFFVAINCVYNNTTPDDNLRKLLVDCFVSHADSDWFLPGDQARLPQSSSSNSCSVC
jgi:hypothetical protein